MAGVTLSFWAQIAASTPGQKGEKPEAGARVSSQSQVPDSDPKVRSQSQEQLMQIWDQRFWTLLCTHLGEFSPAFPAGPEGSLVMDTPQQEMKINLCLFSVPGDLGEGQPPPLGTHKSKPF